MDEYEFSNDYVRIYKKEGIIFIEYLNGTRIDEDKALKIVQERLKMANFQFYPVLSDVRNAKSMDESAKKIFSGSDAMKNVSAGALLINQSPLHVIYGNLYLRANPLPIPTKLFKDKHKALTWLKKYK